mmetsp:Transcript_588/g.1511  ORF Transcript_588/g.1511 Transcript_588/m.1511 type:complete len:107 (-) Transcript_588:723-1043(-)
MSPAAKRRLPLISLEEVMHSLDPIDCEETSTKCWIPSKRRNVSSKRKWGVSLLEPSQAPPAEVRLMLKAHVMLTGCSGAQRKAVHRKQRAGNQLGDYHFPGGHSYH